jgi:DNA-binding NarL/FixJ family response regulator
MPPGTTAMAEASVAKGPDAIRVLICDDVDDMRMLLGIVIGLRPDLHVVGEARDGNEAVSEARRLQPDVILLDLSMPHRTGLDALPELREVAPNAQIVVLSGFAASTMADDVIALGAARFIEKGAEPDEIVDAIAMTG